MSAAITTMRQFERAVRVAAEELQAATGQTVNRLELTWYYSGNDESDMPYVGHATIDSNMMLHHPCNHMEEPTTNN